MSTRIDPFVPMAIRSRQDQKKTQVLPKITQTHPMGRMNLFFESPGLVVAVGLAVLGLAFLSLQYAWWKPAVAWDRPRVLMYHMVSEHRQGARFNKLRVPPQQFDRQLAWLRKNGFEFVFASRLSEKSPLPEKCVCLTFDDGYEDNLLSAHPVLKKHDAVATLYLVEERGGGWSSKKKQHHGDAELADEPKLSDEQVQQMLLSGRWELGGHTISHANLLTLDEADAAREVSQARDTFGEKFGQQTDTFAYPFGLFGERDVQLTRSAGYTIAVTTEPGIFDPSADDRLKVPRIKVSGKEGLGSFVLRMKTGRRGLLK